MWLNAVETEFQLIVCRIGHSEPFFARHSGRGGWTLAVQAIEYSGCYTSQTQKHMEKANKNILFSLLCETGIFYQKCHKNNLLYAFRAFWDALAVWKKTPVIYFNYSTSLGKRQKRGQL
jgi:hypothetical protein